MTRRALESAGRRQGRRLRRGVDRAARGHRHWWEDQEPYTADAAGLLGFLEGETLPWYAMRRTELANRPLICAQAFGEALVIRGRAGSSLMSRGPP